MVGIQHASDLTARSWLPILGGLLQAVILYAVMDRFFHPFVLVVWAWLFMPYLCLHRLVGRFFNGTMKLVCVFAMMLSDSCNAWIVLRSDNSTSMLNLVMSPIIDLFVIIPVCWLISYVYARVRRR